jgi:hypothetical protein
MLSFKTTQESVMNTSADLTLRDHYDILEERMNYIKAWHKANRRLMRRVRQNFSLAPITYPRQRIIKH